MSPPQKGNPGFLVRLEPETAEEANEIFPAVKGRSGGVALALRRLLYHALDKPMPRQFGEIGRNHAIDDLEELVRELEAGPPPEPDGLQRLQTEAQELLNDEDHDAVDVTRLRAILGRVLCLREPREKS